MNRAPSSDAGGIRQRTGSRTTRRDGVLRRWMTAVAIAGAIAAGGASCTEKPRPREAGTIGDLGVGSDGTAADSTTIDAGNAEGGSGSDGSSSTDSSSSE